MDELELLVEETYKHYFENFEQSSSSLKQGLSHDINEELMSIPSSSGILYHIQKSVSVFVIRTFVSSNLREDRLKILNHPENYPSLRLLENGEENLDERLKFFIVDNLSEAEIIHDQLHNRRFPIHEELMCNLSDPGFSWWLTKKKSALQISFRMSVAEDSDTLKLGPLGDRELAMRNFQLFETLIASAGIGVNIQNEVNRVQFCDCDDFLYEELKDLFELGVISLSLRDLFKILSKRLNEASALEQVWFYLSELAAVRRFWIQVQFDVGKI